MDELCTAEEAACYRMLCQVMNNHIEAQRLAWTATYMISVCALGDLGGQLGTNKIDVSRFGPQCARWLKHRLAPRWERLAVFPWFGDEDVHTLDIPTLDAPRTEAEMTLFTALGTLLRDAHAEQGIDIVGGLRILLCMVADVLTSGLRYQLNYTLEEAGALLDDILAPSLQNYIADNTPYTTHRPAR